MDLALNNLQRLICLKTQPTYQSTDVEMGIMEMKEYSTFPRAKELEPHHPMV